jgi:hypothetical protein
MRGFVAAFSIVLVFLAPRQAAAETVAEKVAAFQSRVDAAALAVEESPRLRDLPLEKRRAVVQFVVGNMLFVLLHEMGHTHISEMGLPVLGREEDAADSFAVVTMLKISMAVSDDVLVEAAMGWFLSALRDEKEGARLAFYDAHGLDRQRAYQIVCLMVGSDPDKFQVLADKVGMPEERQSTCRGDFSNASWSWSTVMKPHLRAANQPRTPIKVTYGKAEGDLAPIEKSFRAIRLLETVADQASDEFAWRRPFALEMQTCGEPGALWDLATRRLTLCYERVADFAMLYRQYGDQLQLPRDQSGSPSGD